MSAQLPWLPGDPWKIQEKAFPFGGTSRQKLQFLLNYALLAPSIYNTQPWSFRISDDEIEFFADTRKALTAVDALHRQLILSCGAALFLLITAIRHFEYEGKCRLFPDPVNPLLLASIELGEKSTQTPAMQHRLFMAIKKRRTYRGPFEDRPVDEDALTQLAAAAMREGSNLEIVTDEDKRESIADLVEEAEHILISDQWIRSQRDEWINQEDLSRREGIPLFTFQVSASCKEPPNDLDITPLSLRQAVLNAPAVLILSTKSDKPIDWLKAGKTLGRVLLQATTLGLAASFVNQAIEVPRLRQKLTRQFTRPHLPQLILRIGYPAGHAYTPVPRHPLRSKMR